MALKDRKLSTGAVCSPLMISASHTCNTTRKACADHATRQISACKIKQFITVFYIKSL